MTLTMPWFYGAGALLLSAVLVLLGRWLWLAHRRRESVSGGAIVLWLLAFGIVAIKLPSYILDEIHLDDSQMRWSVGPWWDRTEGVIRIPEARSIRVHKQAGGTRRPVFPKTYWEIAYDNGVKESYVVSDLWMEHYGRIEKHFASRGVSIE